MYLCKCVCGKDVDVLGYNLKEGNTQSCGCLRVDRTRERLSLRSFEALYRHLKRSAKKSNHTVDLSYEDFIAFTDEKECHYCWTPVVWLEHKSVVEIHQYNLDRKASDLGYSKDNLVVCCKRCNYGKNRLFTYDEWWEMTKCFRERYERAREAESSNDQAGEVQGSGGSGEGVRQETWY